MADQVESLFTDVNKLFSHVKECENTVTLSGMLKENETDSSVVCFTPTNCESWVEIDKSCIVSIKYLGQKECSQVKGDTHAHPLVRLIVRKTGSKADGLINIIADLSRTIARNAHVARQAVGDGSRKIKPYYIGPCGASWACASGDVIYCSDNAKPYEDLGSGECECIPC